MILYFERSAQSAVKFRFGHGRYVDLWLLVHVISGILIGIVGLIFNLPLWQILTLSLFLGFFYEIWESLTQIVENVKNSLIDIIRPFDNIISVVDCMKPALCRAVIIW